MTTLLLTTNPGVEDLVEAELREHAAAAGVSIEAVQQRADGWPGRVRLVSPAGHATLRALAEGLCSVHHVMATVWEGPLPEQDPVAGLGAIARRQDWSALLGAATFRASCERKGEHPFGSPDVERAVGAAVHQETGTAVDLEGWQVAVRCDVRDHNAFLAVQYTRRSLGLDRLARPYTRRTALKPTVAWACLRLLRQGMDEAEVGLVADPFCGSGTALVEAGLQLPHARLVGSDSHAGHLPGVRDNLAANGLDGRATLFSGDARSWGRGLQQAGIAPGTVDAIVTNPPYGLRLGAGWDFFRFYASVLAELRAGLRPGGRLVLLAVKRGALNRAIRKAGGFDIEHVRIVETGGVHPGLFVLRAV